mgnify:CR=1 FL=1
MRPNSCGDVACYPPKDRQNHVSKYRRAQIKGMRVTGSELIGLVPKKVLIEAGKYFLTKQKRSNAIPDSEIIHIAVKSLGLDELAPFEPKSRIIEYMIDEKNRSLSKKSFVNLPFVSTNNPL